MFRFWSVATLFLFASSYAIALGCNTPVGSYTNSCGHNCTSLYVQMGTSMIITQQGNTCTISGVCQDQDGQCPLHQVGYTNLPSYTSYTYPAGSTPCLNNNSGQLSAC
jgi:hypothetical protein